MVNWGTFFNEMIGKMSSVCVCVYILSMYACMYVCMYIEYVCMYVCILRLEGVSVFSIKKCDNPCCRP